MKDISADECSVSIAQEVALSRYMSRSRCDHTSPHRSVELQNSTLWHLLELQQKSADIPHKLDPI